VRYTPQRIPFARGNGPHVTTQSLVGVGHPTCVGTSRVALSRERRVPVHPHVRGDGKRAFTLMARFLGSLPRAWGRVPL
jgi:hypothetical protein